MLLARQASKFRVLIAEDEAEQMAHLENLLQRLQPDWQVIARVRDVPSLLTAIEDDFPDLLLLDIHLGSPDGPHWLEKLPTDIPIIFCTGDPAFAIEAFDRGAMDYLLKPVSARRMKLALDRVIARVQAAQKTVSNGTEDAGWLTIGAGASMLLVPHQEIIYAKADLRYTRIISTRGDGLARTGINELLLQLPASRFIRIHRSILVNSDWVASVTRDELGRLDVRLRGRPEILRVSRSYHGVFKS